jgi:hypothetical protein
MSRMVGSVLTFVILLFSAAGAAAQTYTQMQWGVNKGVTPYAFGANINGAWSNLGTVSSAGVWSIPSSNLSFIQSGTGAVTQTVQSKLRLIVNLQDFGGVGDNSTPNDQAFSRAIAAVVAAGGGKIVVPSGKYVITSQVLISDCSAPVFIEGDGTVATIVRQTSNTASGFVWNCGSVFNNGGGLSYMTVESGAGYDTARFTGSGSSGVGVAVIRMAGGLGVFEHLSINNFSYGFAANGTWDADIGFVRALFFTGAGLQIGVDPAVTISGSNRIHNLKLSNNGFTGVNTNSVGMQIGSSGGEYIHEVEITSVQNGVVIAPAPTQNVFYLFMDKVAPDTAVSNNWVLNSTNGLIYSMVCVDCWGSFASGNGFAVFGPAANYANIKFTNFRARENVFAGVTIQTTGTGPTGIEFVAPEIASNSRGRPQLSQGIELGANVNGIQITGGFIGNGGSSSSDQGYGIYCTGNNSISVIGTDLSKYGTGTGEYSCGAGNVITQYKQSAVIPGTLAIGVSGSSVGSIAFNNATSGSITLQPTTGALGAVTATLPANTGTIAETNLAQTFTAIQTFDTTIKLKGYTVAGLTAAHPCNAGAEGSMAYVTDATAPLYNTALTGGGAVKVPVFCDGATWTSH